MFAQPPRADGSIDEELFALSKLETTCNGIRLRIAGLAPDQLYRGSMHDLTIAEAVANAVDRERAFQNGFRRALNQTAPQLEEPRPGLSYMDRDFADDLALFFDLRRGTLDVLRAYSERDWTRTVKLPGGQVITVEQLALMLQRHDAYMLTTISRQKQLFKTSTGVNELRDPGVAGKLGENIGQ